MSHSSRLGEDMGPLKDTAPAATESETLGGRISRLTDAILRISEDLELDTVLQEVADGARLLTGARYTALTTHDESGKPQDVLISGLTDEETERILSYQLGTAIFGYLSLLRESLRTRDFIAHIEAVGFPRLSREDRDVPEYPDPGTGQACGQPLHR